MRSRAGLNGCGKSRPPPGFDPPDRPARSESLYRLRYPGPRQCCQRLQNNRIFRNAMISLDHEGAKILTALLFTVVDIDRQFLEFCV
jgi:hypothetical protein